MAQTIGNISSHGKKRRRCSTPQRAQAKFAPLPSTTLKNLSRNADPKMTHLFFAASIQRHIAMPARDVVARSVDEALAVAFADEPRLRGYILDDQGGLRRHLSVFVDGMPLRDRRHLSDPVDQNSRIYVVQALSGG